MKFYLNILLTFLLANAYSQEYINKIDPKLLGSDQEVEFVIIFKDQADISLSKSLKGKNTKAEYVYNQLILKAEKSQSNITDLLEKEGIKYKSFYIVNMLSAKGTKDLIKRLAQIDEVKSIIEDGKFKLEEPTEEREEGGARSTEWGLLNIKANDVWALGYTGQGVVIGGQDTGYEWDHNALKSKYRGWDGSTANHDYNWHDAIHTASGNPCGVDSPAPCDDHNHGTHTMGTMVGDTANFNIGVAPSAKWIGCRNMNQGDGTLTTYLECFEWFLAPYPIGQTPAQGDPTKAPHVINNSWACPTSEGCNPTNYAVMEAALNNLKNSGVVVIASNGNSGSNCSTTYSTPAFFENSFSVGASNISNAIAGFSSRGPVLADGSNRMKPDVTAPGVSVKSCRRGGLYATYSGTSMAGPHVAGAVALMISANPNLAGEVDQIENILRQTAVRKTSSQNCGPILGTEIPNNTYGWGIIDALAAVNRATNELFTPIIKIDQFGYSPNATKTAILTDPKIGYNDGDSYTPPSTIYVKDASTHVSVFSGSPTIWDNGSTDPLSGDKVWWFDFSSVTTPGTYYISDNNLASETFEIKDDVYNNVLETAFKTFYHQRCGHSKAIPYTLAGYTDAACHSQDATCKFINDPSNSALDKDLSGGWHDAGDYNKYVNFAYNAVLDLLYAYEYNPEAWNDNMGIPESNNGIPDLLDEIIYEMDWLQKMQDTDGGVYCIVGVQNYVSASPPSADNATRYYGPKTTAASYSAAAMMAAAAVQLSKINNSTAQALSITLTNKAISSYDWAVANPNITYNNSGIVAAGEQELGPGYGTDMRRLGAAVYLYQLTNHATYKTYVESNYNNSHMFQWSYIYPFENVLQQILLDYANSKGVTPAVSNAIKNLYKTQIENGTENLPIVINNSDAYRSYIKQNDIGWGSNSTKSSKGIMYQAYLHYQLNTANNAMITMAMEDILHYMHGANPTGFVYLTNMEHLGADKSVNTIYHNWFDNGSDWDDVRTSLYGPVPGFIPGGPNPSWSLDGCCPTGCGGNNSDCILFSPPNGQPALKSYKDWNNGWPQNSWAITENANYYQAAYLSLLSSSVANPAGLGLFQNQVVFNNKDVILENSSDGIVMKSPNNSLFRIRVDTDGTIISNDITQIRQHSSTIKDAHLSIKSTDKGIIFKDTNAAYWKLYIDNSGQLATQLIANIPTEFTEQTSGDIYIQSSEYGVIFTDENGQCFKVEINDMGRLFTSSVTCE